MEQSRLCNDIMELVSERGRGDRKLGRGKGGVR